MVLHTWERDAYRLISRIEERKRWEAEAIAWARAEWAAEGIVMGDAS